MVNVRFLQNVGEYKTDETYEIDKETADKYVAAGLCEVVESELEKAVDAIATKVEKQVVAQITKSFGKKLEAPAVIKSNPEADWSWGDLASRLYHKDYAGLRSKYGEKVISVGSDTAILPTPLANEVFAVKEPTSILGLVRQIAMPSDTYKIPVLNQASVSPSSGSVSYFGCVVGAFGAEDADATATEPEWTSITLNASKYTAYTNVTLEALQDLEVNLNKQLPDLFSRAFQDHMAYFIMQGTGSANAGPTGIIDNAATVNVTRATTSLIDYVDVCNMFSRMASDNGNWTWLVSTSAVPQLLQMEDTEGNLVWQPNARDSVGRTLLGLPVVRCHHCAALGSAGDICLVNLQDGYVFGNRMEATLSFSDHVGFLKGRRMWKLEARVDGKPVQAATLTDADGSTSIGNLIQLDNATS